LITPPFGHKATDENIIRSKEKVLKRYFSDLLFYHIYLFLSIFFYLFKIFCEE
jgi:hypothetical protein